MRNLLLILVAALSACTIEKQANQKASGPAGQSQSFNASDFIVEATIADIQTAIMDGRTTCKAIVRAYLDRIEAYDKTSGLNAITVINPDALKRAEAIDEAIAIDGIFTGSLFCAPILVKDNFDTRDLATTGGSSALANHPPTDDASMVTSLIFAGAVIIAKTNMAEWAFSPRQTVSSSFGRTANAYDLARVPAGSSGGTASGVAANFAVAGLGTDTGNSIRGPASHLALVGIRSTIGLTSRHGVIPLAFDRDIAGPLTRSVEDATLLFNVLAGEDPNDPYTANGAGKREDDYTIFLDQNGLKGARIGVLRALSDKDNANPEVLAIYEQAIMDLRRTGVEIIDPFAIENLQTHLDNDDAYFCPRFRYDMAEYLKSRRADAPLKDVIDVLQTGQYGRQDPRVKNALEFFEGYPADIHPAKWETPCPDFYHHAGRQAFKRDVIAAMDAAGIDAMIYPSWNNPPAPIDKANEEYAGDNSQRIAPATGLPAISVPMGYSNGALPAGLQILGRPYSEGLLFKFAYAYEQATLHRKPPPDFPPLDQ